MWLSAEEIPNKWEIIFTIFKMNRIYQIGFKPNAGNSKAFPTNFRYLMESLLSLTCHFENFYLLPFFR
jgi:hypothetical protein